jgi:hypothetical protein
MVIKFRTEKELRTYGLMVDPDDPGIVVRVEVANKTVAGLTTSDGPGQGTGPVGTSRKTLEEFLVDALADGDHSLQVATPGPPTLVMVWDYGFDDFGVRAWEVNVLDPGSENQLPLAAVVDHAAWLRRFKVRDIGTTRTVADIEREIVALHRGVNFRPTLATFVRIGCLLPGVEKAGAAR